MCDSLYFSLRHGIFEKKNSWIKTEEELADAVNEIVNDKLFRYRIFK